MPCIANSVNEQYECLNFLEVAILACMTLHGCHYHHQTVAL